MAVTPNYGFALDFLGHVQTEQLLAENFKKLDEILAAGGGTVPAELLAGHQAKEGSLAIESVGQHFGFFYAPTVTVEDMYDDALNTHIAEAGFVTWDVGGVPTEFAYLKTTTSDPTQPLAKHGVMLTGVVDGKSVVFAGEPADGAAYLTEDGDIKGGQYVGGLLATIAALEARVAALEAA